MNNTLATRFLFIAVIMIGTIAGVAAFAFMKFPDNAIVIAIAVATVAGGAYFMQRKDKAARFEIYYRTVQEFGTPINFGGLDAAFERAGTRFDVEFPRGENSPVFKVNFRIPNLRQKFSIQNRTFATRYDDDCRYIQDSTLPHEYVVQARNPDFVLRLLKNRQFRNEVLNYNASLWGRVLISLDDGDFELVWSPPLGEEIEGFYQVCQSAVFFHDQLANSERWSVAGGR